MFKLGALWALIVHLIAVAIHAEPNWSGVLAGLTTTQLISAIQTPQSVWEARLFTQQLSTEDPVGNLPLEHTLSETQYAANYRSLQAYLNSHFGNFFREHGDAFSVWSKQVYSYHASRHSSHAYLAHSTEYRSLLVGLKAAYVLGNTESSLKLSLTGMGALDPDEAFRFMGLVIPEGIRRRRELEMQDSEISVFLRRDMKHTKKSKRHPTPYPTRLTATATPTAAPDEEYATLPETLDWRANGSVTPVKDQGSCGCCYAFSATAVTESRAAVAGYGLTSLSEQQLVSCGNLGGCDGGWMASAWWYTQYGQVSEATYPYDNVGSTNTSVCDTNSLTPMVVATSGDTNYVSNEDDLKLALQTGPVSIAISGGNACFQSYTGGMLTCDCPSDASAMDHAVTVVGYGSDYWIVKNSWSIYWGDQGYAYFPFTKFPGTCGMYNYAQYPTNVTSWT